MRTRRAELRLGLLLALTIGAAAAALAARSGGPVLPLGAVPTGADAWRGLTGTRAPVAASGLSIVVLRTPSLAGQVAAAGGRATAAQERAWTAAALAAQTRLLARLAAAGIRLRPELRFARTVDGFSARVDPGTAPLVERDADVVGVYPVRVAYPASVAGEALASGTAVRPPRAPGGLTGRGETVALLDTGVDGSLPYLHGAVRPAIDVVGGAGGDEHGTELAGLLVGSGGPAGLSGVAPGATVLPIRVAAAQPDGRGGLAVYARSDQLIAGLERAVDPNGDGDAHDAARVALVSLAEPYAGFTDGPEARAAAGAAALGTLVVAAAGNDGPAAPDDGDLAGPAAALATLAVGAADTRPAAALVRVTLRSGGETVAGTTALAGAVVPAQRLDLDVAAPPRGGAALADYFTRGGGSIVAGRAALASAGATPADAVRRAAAAGAAAALLDGRPLPAGGLGLDGAAAIPVVSLPARTAAWLHRRLAGGARATLSLEPAGATANRGVGAAAAFSSVGLAFDARPKPELLAPGVALATAARDDRGAQDWLTVSGTSAAAAVVAGDAALLAEARPGLSADALRGLLVGTAGSGGLADVAAAAHADLYATPATLALDAHGAATFTLTNVGATVVHLSLGVARGAGAAVELSPRLLALAPGASASVRLRVAGAPASGAVAEGAVLAGPVRIPWALRRPRPPVPLLGDLALSTRAFSAADTGLAILIVEAGRVLEVGGKPDLRPLARLDVELWRGDRRLGLLTRLRDVLPGRYAFGLTGRGPDGQRLPPGNYAVEVVAVPVDGGSPSRGRLRFALR